MGVLRDVAVSVEILFCIFLETLAHPGWYDFTIQTIFLQHISEVLGEVANKIIIIVKCV